MKRVVFTLISVMLCLGGLIAGPVDVNTAKALGVSFMNHNTVVKADGAVLAYTGTNEQGKPCFYVFSVAPKGFVIVSADNCAWPVLGYSTESSFSAVNIEDGLMTFLENYITEISYAMENGLTPSAEVLNDWESLKTTGRLSRRGVRSVGPLVTTTWHQTQLYNDQCPEDQEGYNGHVKSGCVANAMSQLLNYWEWPKTGTGSHSYYCDGYGSTSYGTLTANFGEAHYRYELMPDFLDYTSPQAEVDAVALLEFHCGVSVDMSYGPSASGAYSGDVPVALEDYFRYQNDMHLEDRSSYSDEQWKNMLKADFDAGRPIYYSAYSYTKDGTRGGHAFVCDGYDENDFFHFNWGWQGFDNGFYSLDAMNLTHHQYNYSHGALFNIHPDEEYYDQPQSVQNLTIVPSGTSVNITMTAPSLTVGGETQTDLDSVVILLNSEQIYAFVSPQPGQTLNYSHTTQCAANYFTIYTVNDMGKGTAVRDTIIMGSTCPLTFQLHDATGDGWLSPAISLLDECGNVVSRVGLDAGANGTMVIDAPSQKNLTLFWNYCNIGYEDDDAECSFQVYDYNNELLYTSSGKPEVGELLSFQTECNMLLCDAPSYMDAEYQWEQDTFGVAVTWNGANLPDDADHYNIYRGNGQSPSFVRIAQLGMDQNSYFDDIEPGTYGYKVTVSYRVGTDDECESEPAPWSQDPNVTIAWVTVSSDIENADESHVCPNPVTDKLHLQGDFDEVSVFDAIGQLVYRGTDSDIDVSAWRNGVYFVRLTNGNGISVEKIIKK